MFMDCDRFLNKNHQIRPKLLKILYNFVAQTISRSDEVVHLMILLHKTKRFENIHRNNNKLQFLFYIGMHTEK